MAADEWCSVDYRGLAGVERWDSADGPHNFGAAISGLWCEHYAVMTPWTPEIVEIKLGQLTYLFDLAPSQAEDADGKATDRVVGVWGRPTVPAGPRDTARQRGFVPNPPGWSGAGFDRGHYVIVVDGVIDFDTFDNRPTAA